MKTMGIIRVKNVIKINHQVTLTPLSVCQGHRKWPRGSVYSSGNIQLRSGLHSHSADEGSEARGVLSCGFRVMLSQNSMG